MASINDYIKSKLQSVRRRLQGPVPQQLQPIARGLENFYNSQNPIVRLPTKLSQGAIEGSNWGMTPMNIPASRTAPERIAYGTGYVVGAINPRSYINRTFMPIEAKIASKLPVASASRPLYQRAALNIGRNAVIESPTAVTTGYLSSKINDTNPTTEIGVNLAAGTAGRSLMDLGGVAANQLLSRAKNTNVETPKPKVINPEIQSIVDQSKPYRGKGEFSVGNQIKKGKDEAKLVNQFGQEIVTKAKLRNKKLDLIADFDNAVKANDIKLAKKISRTIASEPDNSRYAPYRDTFNKLSKLSQTRLRNRVLNEKTNPIAQLVLNQKERKFIGTVRKSDKTIPEVAQTIQGTYTPITNKQTLADAQSFIDQDFNQAVRLVKEEKPTAFSNAVALDLVRRYQNEGRIDEAVDIVETVARKATTQGQAIQALSMWDRLGPDGSLLYTQRLINQANAKSGLQSNEKGFLKLTTEQATKIKNMADELQAMPEGREKTLKSAELVQEIHKTIPPSLLKKISTAQAIFQLLNPKTVIRNLGGNTLFAATENITDVIATPLDYATSLITGKRTKVLPDLAAQYTGLKQGAREGYEEAIRGVDLSAGQTQFDLPKTSTFAGDSIADKIFRPLEKSLNVVLKAPDRAMFQAAYEGSLSNQMRAAGVTEPTDEMIEIATHDGLYRTFQDSNILRTGLTYVKKGFNFGKEFGLGDQIIKYPGTPSSLIMRGIDYSPIGFINTLFQISKPLMGRNFNQKAFVESIARASQGTGLIVSGYILGKLGIITGEREKDKDINAIQRMTGQGAYKLNASALKRFVLSGLNPDEAKKKNGDILVSYDWVQPLAISLSMGANIAENEGKINSKDLGAVAVNSIVSSADTLSSQPLLSGFRTFALTGQGDIVKGTINAALSAPASFVPTLFSQINQFTDNTSRNSYDPNPIKQSYNQAISKVPIASQSLPPLISPAGDPVQRYQDNSNNFFNVFFNPAFVSKIKEDPTSAEVLRIFEDTGETQQAPRIVPKEITINGQKMQLTGEQQAQYQAYVGQKSMEAYNKFIATPGYEKLTDTEKAKKLSGILTDVNQAAKIELFGDKPKTIDKGAKAILAGSYYVPSDSGVGSTTSSSTLLSPTPARKEQLDAIYQTATDYLTSDYYSESDKQQFLQSNNLTVKDVIYDYQTRLADDLQLDEIYSQVSGLQGSEKLYSLAQMRKVSPGSRKPLLTDTLIGKLSTAGYISKAEASFLKGLKEDETGRLVPSSGSKKRTPKLSVAKVSVQGSGIRKLQVPTRRRKTTLKGFKGDVVTLKPNTKKLNTPKLIRT